MLTVEKLKNMQPGEIFEKGEGIDDGKIFNIWGEGWKVKRVAVRGKGYHDRAIYYHLSNEKEAKREDCEPSYNDWCNDWGDDRIASNGDKLTNPKTIKAVVPCDEDSFNLYRY